MTAFSVYQCNFLTFFAEPHGFTRAVKLFVAVIQGRVWVRTNTHSRLQTTQEHSQQTLRGAMLGPRLAWYQVSISTASARAGFPKASVKANKLTAGQLRVSLTAQWYKLCPVAVSFAKAPVHDCENKPLILHFVVLFFDSYFAALWQTLHGGAALLNSITDSWTTHFPTVCPQKQQRYRRANLLSTKRNLAALTKEDQGSQRKVSGLGVWRASVAIALPSCCFAESRFFLSLLRTQQAKNERTRYADVVVGGLRLGSGFFGGLRGWATDRELLTEFKSSVWRNSPKPVNTIQVSYSRAGTGLY